LSVSPAPAVRIRPTEARDATAYAEYIQLHVTESGKEGSPVFTPGGARPGREEIRDNATARWARRMSEPNWGRGWLLRREKDGGVVGHVELRGGRVAPELHRATLGMGMLRAYTGQGHGRRLLETAITWAREQPQLAWIDLGVFTGNVPAIKLYERCGFTREMVRVDAFRHESGVTIDDIFMTLRVR
jgi:RimJ/RimL family protein N-acetyltransferase